MPFTAHLHLSASGLFSGLSWQKWLGAARVLGLWAFMVIGAGMLAGCKHSEQPAAEPHMQPRAPIKLPIPLDKAGYKVDTTFWVIPPKPPYGYFVGLRIPFTAGDGRRIELIDAHPVKARVTLHRMEEGGAETKVVLEAPVKISKPNEPSQYEMVALPNDEAISSGMESYRLSYKPEDKYQVDGAIYELSFSSAGTLAQGQYRLQVELLEENPALKDMPAYLVVDLVPISK